LVVAASRSAARDGCGRRLGIFAAPAIVVGARPFDRSGIRIERDGVCLAACDLEALIERREELGSGLQNRRAEEACRSGLQA
jgi:hypothetical protein